MSNVAELFQELISWALHQFRKRKKNSQKFTCDSAEKALESAIITTHLRKNGCNVKEWIVTLMQNVIYKVSTAPSAIRCTRLLPVV